MAKLALTWANVEDFRADTANSVWDTLLDGSSKSPLFKWAQSVDYDASNSGQVAKVLAQPCNCGSHL